MKIFKKLLLSYMIIFLLPVSFIFIFVIPRVAQETLNQSLTINKISFEQLQSNVMNQFDKHIKLLDSVALETELDKYLSTPYIEGEDYGVKYFRYHRITELYENKYVMSSIDNIRINVFSENENILYGNDFLIKTNDAIKKEKWFEDTIKANGAIIISDVFLNRSNKNTISFSRKLIFGESSSSTHVVRILVPISLLESLIKKEGLNKDIFIVNQFNDIIVSSNSALIGSNLNFTKYANKLSYGLNHDLKLSRNEIKEDILLQEKLGTRPPLNNYTMIYGISPSVVLKNTNELVRYAWLILIISITIALSFIIIFSNNLTGRIKALVLSMSSIKDNNFNVTIESDDRDEIGILTRDFKGLIARIDKLINEVYLQKMSFQELELKQRETEFLALQSQINPHFLFNTIESIRMNALSNGAIVTSDILESFGKLLRKSFDWSSRMVTIEQEISLIKSYIKIQKFRYNNRFDSEFFIEESLLQIRIPKFTIQPLVENAINHGLEMKKNHGLLTIRIINEDNICKIIVTDNGVGISKERLHEVKLALSMSDNFTTSTSIGLINVNQRIKLIYGNEYGLDIEGNIGEGTNVIIILPSTIERDVVDV
jgi:two-component system, sensor histidine kinase YesM